MDINSAIQEVRQKLIDTINQSGLPIEVTRLVLLELQMVVDRQISAIAAKPNEEVQNESDTHS